MSRRNRYGFDDPSVILSGGPSHSRQAEDDDPPYEPQRISLGFGPPRAVEVRRLCETEPTYVPGAPGAEPLLWDGDQA